MMGDDGLPRHEHLGVANLEHFYEDCGIADSSLLIYGISMTERT
jgi:hypothetical protein